MKNDISILIVEDEIITINFIKIGLAKYGFTDISYCLNTEEALKRVEETKPDLILMNISLEERFSGIKLAKVFSSSYKIPVIFVTGGMDNETITKIEEAEPYGLLFKPFRIQTLKVLINIAIKRMHMEQKKEESEKNLEISKIKLLDQIRELDTFYKISQLLNKFTSVEDLIENALPLVASAFNMSEYISTRITYKNKKYESENFKESKWVLSESLSKKYKTGDMIELYLTVEDAVESFPFSIDDINTFSAITQQLSLALQRFSFEEDLNNQLILREVLNIVLQDLIVKANDKLSSIFNLMLNTLGTYLNSDFCQIVLWKKGSGENDFTRTIWTSDSKIEPLILNNTILTDLRSQKKTLYLSKQKMSYMDVNKNFKDFLQTNSNNYYLVIPIIKKSTHLGFLWITLKSNQPFIRDNIDSFKIIGDIILMAISKSQRERKIQIYRQAIEQNPSAIVITDLDGKINYVNPMFTKTSGYTAKEAIGQNPRILKSGHQDSAFYKELWDTLLRGDLWKGIFHNKCKNGSLIWELAVLSPIKDNDGIVTGYIAIKEDISDKVEAEEKLKQLDSDLRNTQVSLVQEEKLASIGRLAAGVAHEIISGCMRISWMEFSSVSLTRLCSREVMWITSIYNYLLKRLVQYVLHWHRYSKTISRNQYS